MRRDTASREIERLSRELKARRIFARLCECTDPHVDSFVIQNMRDQDWQLAGLAASEGANEKVGPKTRQRVLELMLEKESTGVAA